jgi:hypothetical protein
MASRAYGLVEKLPYRSIQTGFPGALIDELIYSIRNIGDATRRARVLRAELIEHPGIDLEELDLRGPVPKEGILEVNKEFRKILEMDES